jgi:vancomycin resistance protein YoaR
MRAQAVPFRTYRRKIAVAHARRQLVVLAAAGLCLVTASPSLLSAEAAARADRPGSAVADTSEATLYYAPLMPAIPVAKAAEPTLQVQVAEPAADFVMEAIAISRVVADARASTSHLDDAGMFNALNAMTFVDGVVVPAGARFVFDDIARTWDYREDASYVPGRATSVRGFIMMRGGGVCAVSTAIWRAALSAGLRTDRRQSHSGLIQPDYAGIDATNTLIVANDSDADLTIHVWLDGEAVRAQLLTDGDLRRSATVSEPQRVGTGRWLVEQEVTRVVDGTATVNRFVSQYYW